MSEVTLKNHLGLTRADYQGAPSTLCTGCGHDQITQHIVTACFELGLDPRKIVKVAGIGCSSKTPAYFLKSSFGVNYLHGRMAPFATGSVLANPRLIHIGMSGDGDTASIGLGSFLHAIRRNVPMVYIVANNGVYGLTKGQFSATVLPGEKSKTGQINVLQAMDVCLLALSLGASFVARSFSGDFQLTVGLIKLALNHPGFALIDIISPCVAFHNHDGSFKSFAYVRSHARRLNQIDFVEEVSSGDLASPYRVKPLEPDFEPKDPLKAMARIQQGYQEGIIWLGLFYCHQQSNYVENLNRSNGKPLSEYTESELRNRQQFEALLDDWSLQPSG